MTDWRVSFPDELSLEGVEVLEAIGAERGKQLAKWGDQSDRSPAEWLIILAEEFGEVAKDVYEMTLGKQTGGNEHAENYRKELVQVAAVAAAAIEAFDKQYAS
jgi:hypothetical protein